MLSNATPHLKHTLYVKHTCQFTLISTILIKAELLQIITLRSDKVVGENVTILPLRFHCSLGTGKHLLFCLESAHHPSKMGPSEKNKTYECSYTLISKHIKIGFVASFPAPIPFKSFFRELC